MMMSERVTWQTNNNVLAQQNRVMVRFQPRE
jgi:hypothetical protein